MARGRIRGTAGRGALALLLACLTLVAGVFVLAPGASAAPAVTVEIKDLTPPVVSVDPNGTVTFVNRIQDKTVQVGGGVGLLPSLLTVVVHTDVSLHLPSGDHPLQEDQQWAEQFPQSCLTCTITYTYRATIPGSSLTGAALAAATGQALGRLPQTQLIGTGDQQTTVTIGLPTPFVVNTLLPLPNLPSTDLPQLPPVQLPAPGTTVLPGLPRVPVPGGAGTVTTTTTTTTRQGIAGTPYSYLGGAGAPRMAPQPGGTAAFDPRALAATLASSSASGGPVQAALADASASSAVPASSSSPLSVPALAAVLALAGVSGALARVHRLARR
jgi:hypothetical protein